MSRERKPYSVRAGTDEDIDAVLGLMRRSLGEGKIPRTREFWAWKHRENPFGPSPMLLAFSEAELVGVRLFMRWRFQTPTGSARAVRAVDTATHPDWQGQGIFKRLTLGLVEELTREGVDFVFNTPNSQSRPGYLKMGWHRAGRVALWVRPYRPLRALLSALQRRQDPEVELASAGESAPWPELEHAEQSGLLQSAVGRGRGYTTPLSRAYLSWRYVRCPAAHYELSAVDPSRGLVVHRSRSRNGLRELTITEVAVGPGLSGVRATAAAIRRALAEAQPDYAIAALRVDGPEALALAACGFIPAPELGPILTVRPLQPTLPVESLRGAGAFNTSLGDLELF